ncbi:MAG TPA: 3'-5' exonuclease [Candidatus Moranbacteria bacterium]|nr:3'-5' exonuclease [Candidatus Moranbacteria bacterium]
MNKKNLLFLDTETTGNDLEKDRLCQVCYKIGDKIETKNFKPEIPISTKAMSITHITNKMVENEESFADSQFKKALEILLKENVLVAHNAKFDIAMLNSDGVEVKQHICTLRLARHLDEQQEIPEYNLQFLRYYYEVEIEANPHSAEGDVLVLEAIFKYLYRQMEEVLKTKDESKIIKEMIEVSARPSLIRKFNFGKHQGRLLSEIVAEDRGYLEWLLAQKEKDEDEDWIYTLRHYLG